MEVQVVKKDRVVAIDGEGLNFDFELASNIWAIQWDGSVGEVEYNDATPNLPITDFSAYQYLIDAYAVEKQRVADAEAQADVDRIASLTYAEKRAQEYPTIVDQLDDIFHNGLDGWKASIQVVKDRYPKS